MNAVERMSPKFNSCAAACRGLPREENIVLFGGWWMGGRRKEVCALAGMDWRFRRRGEKGSGWERRGRRVQLAKKLFVTSWTDVQCQTEVLEVELWTPSINNLCAFLCRGSCFMRVHRSDFQRHVLRTSLNWNWFLSLLTFRGLSMLWHQVESFMKSEYSMNVPWIGGSKASTSNRSLYLPISNPRISLDAMVISVDSGGKKWIVLYWIILWLSSSDVSFKRSESQRQCAFNFKRNLAWIF
jgi:hypothetical protein